MIFTLKTDSGLTSINKVQVMNIHIHDGLVILNVNK